MKIAITADLHLTSAERNPERFQTLENILQTMQERGCRVLIIAGDLFSDRGRHLTPFEELCTSEAFRDIAFHIIPGNHDAELSQQAFAAPNIVVYSKSKLVRLANNIPPFLFVPYAAQSFMGRAMASHAGELPRDNWVLIGHGDWVEGLMEPDPEEPGLYMPLTGGDVQLYRPIRAFLGHIHKPFDSERVHYPGSPIGLSIAETGRRRFLVYDARRNRVSAEFVDSAHYYFSESFVILPVDNEVEYLTNQIEKRIEGWALTPEELEKCKVKVKVAGYTADKEAVLHTVKEAFDGIEMFDSGPDLAHVAFADDPNRADIASKVARLIDALDWQDSAIAPAKDEILLHALNTIYSG